MIFGKDRRSAASPLAQSIYPRILCYALKAAAPLLRLQI
jgi:hypothetical protein